MKYAEADVSLFVDFHGNSDYSAPTRQGLGEEKIIISQKGYYFPFG